MVELYRDFGIRLTRMSHEPEAGPCFGRVDPACWLCRLQLLTQPLSNINTELVHLQLFRESTIAGYQYASILADPLTAKDFLSSVKPVARDGIFANVNAFVEELVSWIVPCG